MEDYLIEGITEFKALDSSKTYLILFHVDKQPPHLGVIVNDAYFSLRCDKLQMGIEPKSILKTVRAKKIPTLFFEIESGVNLEIVEEIFEKYASIDQISCLFPIRELFFTTSFEDIQLVFDLLDKLKANERVLRTYSLNLAPSNSSFTMRKYSIKKVQEEIKRLKK